MKKYLVLTIIAVVLLLIGRNLTFLPQVSLPSSEKNDASQLKERVEKILDGKQGSYSVYFSDLDKEDELSVGINENQIHTGASLNKIYIVAAVYQLAQEGKLDLDEKITIQKDDIQDYGTGILRYEKPGGVYSIRSLSRLALNKSDNTAAYILSAKAGAPAIQNAVDEWGLSQTHMEQNKTSAYDTYLFFKKLVNYEIVDKSLSIEILGFMKDTDIEDRIPALLPKDAKVYHKTADAQGGVHDAGIVERPDGSRFFLGVMASDVSSLEQEAKTTISDIAKEAWDFEN